MRIRMVITQRGAADGYTLRTYEAGTEHELGPEPRALDLAQCFIREGWAVDVTASPLVLLCACGAPLPADAALCESCEDKATAPENTLAAPGETTTPKPSKAAARAAAKAARERGE